MRQIEKMLRLRRFASKVTLTAEKYNVQRQNFAKLTDTNRTELIKLANGKGRVKSDEKRPVLF